MELGLVSFQAGDWGSASSLFYIAPFLPYHVTITPSLLGNISKYLMGDKR